MGILLAYSLTRSRRKAPFSFPIAAGSLLTLLLDSAAYGRDVDEGAASAPIEEGCICCITIEACWDSASGEYEPDCDCKDKDEEDEGDWIW